MSGGWDILCITFDLDWAPEPAVALCLELLDDAGVPATFFATHDSPLLGGVRNGVEVGLHPRIDDGVAGRPLDELLALYPDARGARTHSLAVSSPILEAYAERGLVYESNVFLPFHPGLQPVSRYERLVSLPFYWSDDHHLLRRRAWAPRELRLDRPGLKIFNFHPIHVLANTGSPEHYESFKPHYQEPEELVRHRNEGDGVRTLFTALLGQATRSRTATLAEVAEEFLGG